ncbi:MAG: ribonuclease III family protein [Candidatus Coproplasma sp.]
MQDIERALGYVFKDKLLLKRALTLKGADPDFNNESLECLGDAIVGFVVAEKYYKAGYDEGGITERKKTVAKDEALAEVSKRLGLDRALIRPKGEDNNKKAVPSAYEAITAAIYVDGGMEEAKSFVLRTLDFDRREIDYIAALQEELQGRGRPLPEYGEAEDLGTNQRHDFKICVKVEKRVFTGRGTNSSEAKRDAAKKAYLCLTQQPPHAEKS